MDSNIRLNFDFCKNLSIDTIQKLIKYIFLERKKPKYIKIYNKSKFNSLNLIFGTVAPSDGKMQINITLEELHDYIFKKINDTGYDLSVLNRESIKPFIMKRSIKMYSGNKDLIDSKSQVGINKINDFVIPNSESEHWLVCIDCEMVETICYPEIIRKENLIVENVDLFKNIDNKFENIHDDIKNFSMEELDQSKESLKESEENQLDLWNLDEKELSQDDNLLKRYRLSFSNIKSRKVVRRMSELGRITILDHKGDVIYEKFVKPKYPVSNYRTKYSGLTKYDIDSGIDFDQMQTEILKIIGKNTVILGHSLENDLTAMKLKHDLLIDTARLYRTLDNHKVSLKSLTNKYLKKAIQNTYHNSEEDALATLELFSLQVKKLIEYKNSNSLFDNIIKVKRNQNFKNFDFTDKSINTFFTKKFEVDFKKNDDSLFITFFIQNGEIHYSFLRGNYEQD